MQKGIFLNSIRIYCQRLTFSRKETDKEKGELVTYSTDILLMLIRYCFHPLQHRRYEEYSPSQAVPLTS